MTLLQVCFLLTATMFVIVTGMNDGGAVLAPALKVPTVSLGAAVAVLAALVALAPALFGTQVATTFARRLVTFHGEDGRTAMCVGVAGAIVVVGALTVRGVPTSLTLAVVGGLSGAGLASGQPVAWGRTGLVLLTGALAPLIGAGVAYGFSALLDRAPSGAWLGRAVGRTHRLAFPLLCFAYGVNDGQKMLAVLAAATAAGTVTHVTAAPLPLLAMAVLFVLGLGLGLRRAGNGLGNRLLAVRPMHVVTAELAAAGVVIGSAALGMPVSMTQALAGGFVGAGMRQGLRKIRWEAVMKIGLAWLVTLPSSLLVGAAGATAVGWLR